MKKSPRVIPHMMVSTNAVIIRGFKLQDSLLGKLLFSHLPQGMWRYVILQTQLYWNIICDHLCSRLGEVRPLAMSSNCLKRYGCFFASVECLSNTWGNQDLWGNFVDSNGCSHLSLSLLDFVRECPGCSEPLFLKWITYTSQGVSRHGISYSLGVILFGVWCC